MKNNSTQKMNVGFRRKPDGNRWVYIELIKYPPPYPTLIPSFLDLHRIIQAIADCEDERYPPPQSGRTKLAKFLYDAAVTKDFSELARKYQIPIRSGDVVVQDNGAKVSTAPLNGKPVQDDPPLTWEDIPAFNGKW